MRPEYNDELHEYRIGSIVVPGVTTILKAAGLYDDSFFTKESRDRGTCVHKACLYHLQNDLIEDTIPDEYRGYIEAFKRFMAESDCKPHIGLCEIPWFSEIWRFAGTPDMPCILNGKESLLDIKSGVESLTTGVQLAAYSMLYDVPMVNRYGLYLKAGGKYKLTPYTDRNDIKIFNAALTLYHWRQERKLL